MIHRRCNVSYDKYDKGINDMKLYVMRHGQASFTAPSDELRELTDQGREESIIMARWLATKESDFSVTFVSPYVRAKQTYECVIENFNIPVHHYCLDDLTPESSPSRCGDALLAYCAEHCSDNAADNALVVSHLPLVGLLISDLCKGEFVSSFTTSSIACIDIDLDSWKGSLLWHRTFNDVLMGAS